jgi:hypothetical protein
MPTPAAATLPADALVLGRYRPLRPLGTGGSGSVWLARDERSGLDVALKIVPREGKAADRAAREAEAAARLRHERCLRAYALAHDSGHVYIAYEYVPGRTLREAMRAGELDDRAAIEAAAQICDGLAHAHAHGIVHRDVKPANVLLAEGSRISVRILDFGLAQMDEAETLTAIGDVPGTLAYISPERLRGEDATPAADVWAVGVLLWEALAGGHPFWKPSLLESARAIEAGAPPLASLRPDLPKPLAAAVDRALSLDPARRPSASALADALRATGKQRSTTARELRIPRVAIASAALAGLTAGGAAAALPFYPRELAVILAVAASLAAAARPRLGLAVALAVPILPLGNLSLGLAVAYAAVAAAWLALFAREPRYALLPVLGPLLGPVAALGLVPLLSQTLRSPFRRALAAAATVALAFPPALDRIGIAGSDDPDAAAGAFVRAIPADVGLLALALAAVSAALAFARTPWQLAGWGAGTLAAALLISPALPALPVIAAVWATCALKAWR